MSEQHDEPARPRTKLQLTPALERCLAQAYQHARTAKHAAVTESHLVVELLQTGEVQDFLTAAGLEQELLVDMAAGCVAEEQRRPWYRLTQKMSPRFKSIVQSTASQALSADLAEVTPLMMLVQILSPEHRGLLAERLEALGLDELAVKLFIACGNPAEQPLERPQTSRCEVVIFNDPYTTMEFVVDMLREHFGYDDERATSTMMAVHHDGSATLGPYTTAAAYEKVQAVHEAARAQRFPLRLTLLPDG